jgi:arsenate reductase
MKDIKMYWLPHCSTCQKAVKWLDRRGIKPTEFRDIKEEPLTRDEVEKLSKMVGGPENLFSKRAVKYREMKLNERELSGEEMLELMAGEYTFLKRPIMVIGNAAEAGFFEKFYKSFLEDNYYNS